MTTIATLDFETRSYADLKKVGTVAYSEHKTTDIICACWGIDDKPVQSWWPGKHNIDDLPTDLAKHIKRGGLIEAHHVAFERSIWENVAVRKYNWPKIPVPLYRDTMAVACYYGMPAALDKLARALHFEPKDPEGARLITRYSKLHLKTAKPVLPEQDLEKFVKYCRHDVAMEQSISDYLGDLPKRELEIFLMDQEINFRGLYLDIEGIEAATAIVDQVSEKLTTEFNELTGFNPTQRDAIMRWCAEQGVDLDNLQAEYLRELLDEDDLLTYLPQGPVRRAIEIRLAINKASTSKLDAMHRQRSMDGRARCQSRYHGAITGRWTGSGFQPLNLVRGFEDVAPEQLVRDILVRDPRWLALVYGDPMDAVSKASRHWITAADQHQIFAGDYTSIEAVILACLAGEQWKIDAFAEGAKIYELMADKIYKFSPGTVTKATHPAERQDGKTCELAFGYQGALGAWLKFDSSGRHSDERIIEICKSWRTEHPNIVAFWGYLESAAMKAVRGSTTKVTEIGVQEPLITFEMVDEWLTMILPSQKRLWYREPQIRMRWPQWHRPTTDADCRALTCDCQKRPTLTYLASKGGHWNRVHTYGGKLSENATQATSREVLVEAMLRLRARGYPIVLSVYDEIVCEVPNSFGSLTDFKELMVVRPEWASEWPIFVTAWQGQRYKK